MDVDYVWKFAPITPSSLRIRKQSSMKIANFVEPV
jgi:hypothetical protein